MSSVINRCAVYIVFAMEFVNRIRRTIESSTLFVIWGPQEGGKTALLRAVAKILGKNAAVVCLKEKQDEWRKLDIPMLRPLFKPEDLVEMGISGVRHIDTSHRGHVPQWRQIACSLLDEWGFKIPVCENTTPLESGIMSWARAEFSKLKEYIVHDVEKMEGGIIPAETYIDIIAVTISRLAGHINVSHLIIDDVVAQLGRFKIASWALLQRNWLRMIVGQQIYYAKDIYELRELATASDAICVTPLKINDRVRWKQWHMLALKELKIPLRPKNGHYVCVDDYGSYEVPFKDVVNFV